MPKPSTDMDEAKAISDDATTELESGFHYSKKASTKNMKALALTSTELLQTLVDVVTVSGTEISADLKVYKFPSYSLHFKLITNWFLVLHCGRFRETLYTYSRYFFAREIAFSGLIKF